MNDASIPLHDLVGFDYVAALRDILKRMTYEELAFRIGYSSTGGITAVLKGRVPSHRHGEAIWALYLELYGRKPPLLPAKDLQNGASEKVVASL